MARKLLLTPIIILSGFFTNAQQAPEFSDEEKKKKTDANIIGDVQFNGEHVPFINITVEGTTIGTMTDATGHYRLVNLPEGELMLRVSGLGYKSQTKKVNTLPHTRVSPWRKQVGLPST